MSLPCSWVRYWKSSLAFPVVLVVLVSPYANGMTVVVVMVFRGYRVGNFSAVVWPVYCAPRQKGKSSDIADENILAENDCCENQSSRPVFVGGRGPRLA